MRGQIGSVDAVISLSVLTAMMVLWAHLLQDMSPVPQIYVYRATQLYAEHVADELLFNINAPWLCRTPNGIPVPACIRSGASISPTDLGLDDMNVSCRLQCTAGGFSHPCTASPPSGGPPVYVLDIRLCVGDWNNCTWADCNLEVWHR